ncbi:MAG TPA: hypothetical protein VLA20_05865, partial [Vicinamibacterales bacterium]|nr:hypothetical protein [Vicinamibacterales bacterium]
MTVADGGPWRSRWRRRRASRALERQLDYQRTRLGRMPVAQVTAYMQRRSRQALELISSVAPVGDQMRILEVGCGSRGLI